MSWFEWEYAPGSMFGYDPEAVDWSDEIGYESPEQAAASAFPPPFVRIDRVQYHPDGHHAVVELLTNEEPYLYPYTGVLRTRLRRALARGGRPQLIVRASQRNARAGAVPHVWPIESTSLVTLVG
jgi:hypothetical protein